MAKDSGSVGSKQKSDDLEAVRTIRDALDGFQNDERERILRWVRESLGLPGEASPATTTIQPKPTTAIPHPSPTPPTAVSGKATKDIATFVDEKNPQTDIQLATTIAYYYRFVAPPNERKDEIDADSLREALRLGGRPGALVKPLATLNNAHAKGLLDRGSERGMFAINSVGENLVGMTLPGDAVQTARKRERRPKRQRKAAKPRQRQRKAAKLRR